MYCVPGGVPGPGSQCSTWRKFTELTETLTGAGRKELSAAWTSKTVTWRSVTQTELSAGFRDTPCRWVRFERVVSCAVTGRVALTWTSCERFNERLSEASGYSPELSSNRWRRRGKPFMLMRCRVVCVPHPLSDCIVSHTHTHTLKIHNNYYYYYHRYISLAVTQTCKQVHTQHPH